MRRRISIIVTMLMLVTLFVGCINLERLLQEQEKTSAEVVSEDEEPDWMDLQIPENNEDNGSNEDEDAVEIVDVGYRSYHNFTWSAMDVSTEYSVPFVVGEDADKYVNLQTAFENWGADKKEVMDTVHQDLVLTSRGMSAAMEISPEYYIYLNDKYTPTVMRADSRAVSIYYYYESYWGGAHGYGGYYGSSFDTNSGKQLTMEDVVVDMPAFYELINRKLQEEYADIYADMKDVQTVWNDYYLNNYGDWTMNSESITVYFNAYTLGYYAMGAQVITVYFDEAPELFNEYYTEVPEAYVLPLTKLEPLCLDVNKDGVREELVITENYNAETEDYGYYDFDVTINGQTVHIDTWAFGYEGYVVYSGGNYYLYLIELLEGDGSNVIHCIDLQTMTYDASKAQSSFIQRYVYEEDEYYGDSSYSVSAVYPFINPAAFSMTTRMDVLGTYSGVKDYYVDENGYPASEDTRYNVKMYYAVRTLMEIDAKELDEEGNEIGSYAIPQGSYLMFAHTDNATFVDVNILTAEDVMEEGSEDYPYFVIKDEVFLEENRPAYRIYLEYEGYPSYINGLEEDEVMEGIMYVG